MQAEFPARLVLFQRRLARRTYSAFWQAGQLPGIGDQQFPTVGGVEYVFVELAGKAGEFLLDFAVTLLVLIVKFGAGETEIAHRIVDDLLLRRSISSELGAAGNGLVTAV